ncbi:uncharacterized protein LOC108233627 [Kryptolebias marmoratus]|uniref:uncharacterized protein LOC108233627 n=1 Tax=Kryptolebias marmoratus TaxID=37003 RepID=UPI0018ACAC71|nr:uncharacterized protein LOC108233627 [Kryptolebias marmoratus]
MSPKEVVTEIKMPSPRGVFHQTIDPTQPFVTQLPMLPPPPHPNFQSTDLHHQTRNQRFISLSEPPATHNSTSEENSEVLGTTLDYLSTDSQTVTSSNTQFHHQVNKESVLESDSQPSEVHSESENGQIPNMFKFQPTSQFPVGEPSEYLKLYTVTQTQSPATQTKTTHSVTSEAGSYQSKPNPLQHTKSPISYQNTFSQIPQTKQIHSQSFPHQPFTLSFSPKFHLELSTLLPPTQPQTLQADVQPSTTASSHELSPQQHPALSFSTISPLDPGSSLPNPEVNWSSQQNTTQLPNDADGQRKNTSQSPMTSNDPKVTQQSPSWLPVLEKHDVPIVVGVGVSLAFIFITVTFYSVVQKNEPAPTGRSGVRILLCDDLKDGVVCNKRKFLAQRNCGLPVRHADRRAAGRTYENRAFEDDDCVTVIEQSPNTSDTRARPPGPSLVTVQMEPTCEEVQDVTQSAVDHHSVTMETYPEPIVDTEIDPTLEDDKRCSLSQPSIQLQCAEDWSSNTGDNHSPCHDALPPPSSLPSPSPSPPSRTDDTLHSSLTFQSAESPAAPVHHSLSISHGNPPLQLSHHLSLGLTTVAVDVQFFPSATASTAVNSSTHISSVSNSTSVTAPLFSPPLFSSKETDE